MLPKTTGTILPEKITTERKRSKTYEMDLVNKRIIGVTDGIDAVRQAVYCILNTERYEHLAYSWNYGIELNDLYGRGISYVKSEIKRRIREALLQDDRISGVDEFSFAQERGKLSVSFIVKSLYGELKAEKEVMV